ncbi:MAG: hypothetical protein J5585_02640 [Clostridia bacterium]|nr:hypothetical protein [Clostridia bacterium]
MKKAIILLLCLFLLTACTPAPEEQTSDVPQNTTSPEQETPGAKDADTNIWSTYGRIVYKDGYTYFVSPGKGCDGSVSGSVDSEDIYRLKDGETTPEFILAVPCTIVEGVEQTSVFGLVPYGDCVYFLRSTMEKQSAVLCRSQIGSGTWEELDLAVTPRVAFIMNSYNEIDGMLYTMCEHIENGHYSYSIQKTDLKTKEVTLFSQDLETDLNGNPLIIRVDDDGYVYYAMLDEKDEAFGIFRAPFGGGKSAEVIPTEREPEALFVSQGYVLAAFEGTEDTLEVYGVENGEKIGDIDLPKDAAINVCGDTVYYYAGGSLCSVKTDGSDRKTLAIGNEDQKFMMLAVCGDRFFFADDDLLVYQMDKNGKILPAVPVVGKPQLSEEKSTEDGILYREYDNAVCVIGYSGSDPALQIPASINGKPVKIVELMGSKLVNLSSIKIPEGVVSAVVYSCRDVTEVYLPSTLKHMVYRGFPYSFECAEGCVFNYNGTKADWQELYDYCREYHNCAVDTYGTKDPAVKCSDGTWKLPE